MSNIIWQQPDGRLAITSLVEATIPEEHARELVEIGNIPETWIPVAFDYQGTFPDTPMEYWYFESGVIKTQPVPEPVPISPVVKLQEFLDSNPDVKALLA